jgi:hypothetical protein
MPRVICGDSRTPRAIASFARLDKVSFARFDKLKHVPQAAVGYALACPAGRQHGPGVWPSMACNRVRMSFGRKGGVPLRSAAGGIYLGSCLNVRYREGREIRRAAWKAVERQLRASSARLDKLKHVPHGFRLDASPPSRAREQAISGRQPGQPAGQGN